MEAEDDSDTMKPCLTVCQGAAASDNEVEEKASDDPHKLLDINLDESVSLLLFTFCHESSLPVL